jgi:type I restriction enzyme S subunit
MAGVSGKSWESVSQRLESEAKIPEDWVQEPLHNVVQEGRKICYGIVQPGSFEPRGIPLIRGRDYSFGWAPPEEMFRVSAEIDRPYQRSRVRPGDLLLTIVGAGTGNVATVPEWLNGANITQTTARIAVNPQKFEPGYVRALLESRFGKNAVYRAIKGGAQPGLNIADVERFRFPYPPLAEQRRIAEILSTWDWSIGTVEALISNARIQKKAFIQSLLTGKKRLPGFTDPWRVAAIGDVAVEVSERAGNQSVFPVLTCSKYDGMVMSLTYFNKKVYSDDTSLYKVMRRGTFGFPSNHVEEGSIGYQDICDAGIVSPIYCVFRSSREINDDFLYKVLKSDRYRQIFAAATNASVDRRGSLRWRDFAKIEIPQPSLGEQVAISEAICAGEEAERAYASQLAALRREKAALMQQLLTGKRRVKVDGGHAA